MSRTWDKAKQGGKIGAIGGAIMGALGGIPLAIPTAGLSVIGGAIGGALGWGLTGAVVGGAYGAVTKESEPKVVVVHAGQGGRSGRQLSQEQIEAFYQGQGQGTAYQDMVASRGAQAQQR